MLYSLYEMPLVNMSIVSSGPLNSIGPHLDPVTQRTPKSLFAITAATPGRASQSRWVANP